MLALLKFDGFELNRVTLAIFFCRLPRVLPGWGVRGWFECPERFFCSF